MPRRGDVEAVAEIQGLYGPFFFPEKLLQKIWLRGDFDRAACQATDGRQLQVLHPGKWNLLGGPDFKGARLRFADGPEVTGDVELHLNAEDWTAHGHVRDRAYDGVVLHVVLFPPDAGYLTQGAGGRPIPVLTLLPLLLHDLEEFAAEEAVELLANRPASRVQELLGKLGFTDLKKLLCHSAERRWRQKVHFARLRVQRLGWEAACHHAALEILGYRFNRAPMLRIAAAQPLGKWASGAIDPDEIHAAEAGAWSLQGTRPANYPRTRLRQYAAWVRAVPDWPTQLDAFRRSLPVVPRAMATAAARREFRLAPGRGRISSAICADAVGGTRFDNLVCDGFLPMLAVASGDDLAGLWYHWYTGDLPPILRQALRGLGLVGGPGQTSCHGLQQGLLGWLLEREREEASPSGRGA